MGFSTSLLAVSYDVRPFLSYIPGLSSLMSFGASPVKTIEHDISFELRIPQPSRTLHKRPRAPPTPVALPNELVFSIIEMAAYDNDDTTPHTNLLTQCALVCRAWSALAQKLLFSHVSLRKQAACDAFREAINRSTQRGCMLGDAVIRLRIVIDHNQPFGISQTSFGRTIALCPNLYELNLSVYGCGAPGQDLIGAPDLARMRRLAPSFDGATLSLLREGPRITAFEFNNWSENQELAGQLLDVWPSIKAISLGGTPPLPPSPLLAPFAYSLEQVRMNCQVPPSLDFINWLLCNSTTSLRVLALDREPSFQLLDHLITTHGASLHSLSLPSCHTPEQVLCVEKCQQLKELRIGHSVVAPKLFTVIPEGIQHIAIGLSRNSHLQSFLQMVRSSDSLEAMTVVLHDGGDQHPLFPALKMACAVQGIELKFIPLFRSTTRVDPVRAPIFPRDHTLNNIYHMHSL